jgi:hypothetical protein
MGITQISKSEILRKLNNALAQNYSPRPLPRRLIWKTNGKQRFVTFFRGQSPEYFCDIPN